MKTPCLIHYYGRYSAARLDLKAQNISAALTGNPYFSPDNPLMDEFTDARALFSTELDGAASGDRVAIARKNKAKQDLLNVMRRLAINLEDQASGDKAKLISTGFDLASEREIPAELQVPGEFKLVDGINAGEIRFSIKKVPQAVAYVYEYTTELPTEESKWISKITVARKHTFNGITSGTRVYGRILVIGYKSQQAYTHTLSRIVQ